MMSNSAFRYLHRAWKLIRGQTDIACAGYVGKFNIHSKSEYKTLHRSLFERKELAAFLRALRPDDVVYEVGGHIGSWSIFIAQRLTQGQLVVFEPDEHNAETLRQNVAMNGLDNVQVHTYAVSHENGEAILNLDPSLSTGVHSLVNRRAGARKVVVPTITIDDVPEKLGCPKPTAFKIDCEGAEGFVLDGAAQTLAEKRVRCTMIEVHSQMLKLAGTDAATVLAQLKATGLSRLINWGDGDPIVSRHLLKLQKETPVIEIDGNAIENVQRLKPHVKQIKRRDHRKIFLHPPGKNHYFLLADLADRLCDGLIVELGTHHGTSSLAMSTNPNVQIVTYDIEDHYGVKPKPANVETRLGNIFDLGQESILLDAKMIFLDTAHTGDFEQQVYDYLIANNYKGLLLLDDIFWNQEMIDFWEGIDTTKYDLTRIGHGDGKGPMGNVSGTGLVDFSGEIKILNL